MEISFKPFNMKYYIIQKKEQSRANDFEIIKVGESKVEEFEKQYAGQMVVADENFVDVIAAFEKKLRKGGSDIVKDKTATG
jgi:hypothetical protein